MTGPWIYTHTGTIRGHHGVPLRREGRFWWARYEVAFGIVWSSQDVSNLVELAEPIVVGGVA